MNTSGNEDGALGLASSQRRLSWESDAGFVEVPSRLVLTTRGCCRAFTLIELLTVIAVITVLAGMILPAVLAAKSRAKEATCASNLRQFALALHLYAQDYKDELPPNSDGRDEALGATWVEGWLGLPGPDCTNTVYLRQSVLAPYLGQEVSVWQCPSARRPVKVSGVSQPRVRTVSLNCFLGSPVESPAARTYRRLSDIRKPIPSEMFAFLDERVETINDGSFALQWDFSEQQPEGWILRDKPGTQHRSGANLAFADAHVERHRWRDKRTVNPPRDDAVMAGNPDILWLQQHATWRSP
ncbi:MAG: DUF1559 domain-containing protein [Verrucomicrobiales bacterium]|nr:DUF1559 domain-containing protein [Verrucomicrobiales bacterium]